MADPFHSLWTTSMAQRRSTGYTPSTAPSAVRLLALLRAEDLKVPNKHLQPEAYYAALLESRPYLPKRMGDSFRLSRVGKAAAAQSASVPREPGSADEATPSCDGPADESNSGSSSSPDCSSNSSCRNSSSSSHISCKSTSSKRSSSSASDGKSEHRGEYCRGFKLSQMFAKGQHVGYEATCYLHKAGDGWACRRTCNFVKNNNPERRRS